MIGRRRPAIATHAALLAIAWALGLSVPVASAEVSPDNLIPLSQFPREPLVIETRNARRHTFDAWRADTPATHEQGLMFVRGIADDRAMIFIYEPPARVSMWMKNTLIPLDLLFVDEAGCVTKVEHEAKPLTLALISAEGPVTLVVELKAGVAEKLGIGVGDRVQRPRAGWPAGAGACSGNH